MIRSEIKSLIDGIQPLDDREAEHIAFVQKWIDSGAELFRISKPATPDPHLVAYCCLIDPDKQRILLVEHKKANLWIPPGGHIDLNEHPKDAAKRELFEELGIQADFVYETPLFLTVTETSGVKDKHTDVSLWYILKASIDDSFHYDEQEFHSIRWFSPAEIPADQSDLVRLIQKISAFI